MTIQPATEAIGSTTRWAVHVHPPRDVCYRGLFLNPLEILPTADRLPTPQEVTMPAGDKGWVRHPVAIPMGAALLAVALLAGVGWVAADEASRTIQGDAQARVRSNRDAAVRALVGQTNGFETTVSTWAANAPVIDSLRAPTPASLRGVQDQLSTLARSKNSPSAFVTDTRGRIVALYPPNLSWSGRTSPSGTGSRGSPEQASHTCRRLTGRLRPGIRWSSGSPPPCSTGPDASGLSLSCGSSAQCDR